MVQVLLALWGEGRLLLSVEVQADGDRHGGCGGEERRCGGGGDGATVECERDSINGWITYLTIFNRVHL